MEQSVYSPGAGHRPPVLAGRDELIRSWRLMLNDADARGRVGARDIILAGPRGIGKTAAVLSYADIGREQGYEVVNLQAAAGTASLIDSLVRHAERRSAAGVGPWQRVKRVFERIAAINVNVAGFGGGIATHPHPQPHGGVAPEDLADALSQLAREVRNDRPHGGVLVTVDELQVAAHVELALLAAALQRLNADHPDSRVLFASTALPHITEVLEDAGVTHPDRLFELTQIPLTLAHQDALYAIIEPARAVGVSWQPEAAERVAVAANGYPAHLQLFADHAWKAASDEASAITLSDAQSAVQTASERLEERSFGPRIERLTDRQAELLTAVAVNGGRASTSKVTITLARASAATFSRTREELLIAGDLYAPRHGEMALTVPLLTEYLLAHYEQIRTRASVPLLSLTEMQQNARGNTSNRGSNPADARTPGPQPASRHRDPNVRH